MGVGPSRRAPTTPRVKRAQRKGRERFRHTQDVQTKATRLKPIIGSEAASRQRRPVLKVLLVVRLNIPKDDTKTLTVPNTH